MKKQLLAMALAVVASSAMAQAVSASLGTIDTSNLKRVDGANRVQSSILAGGGKAGDSGHGAPLTVVDASGKAVGRYSVAAFVLVPYNSQLAAVYLGGDFDPQAGKSNKAGFNWGNSTAFYYQTPDCTNTPYSGFGGSTAGAKYVGFTVKDDGQHYAYIGDPAKAVNNVLMQSVYDFDKETCFRISSSITGVGAGFYLPLTDVIPLSSLGTPPFVLK